MFVPTLPTLVKDLAYQSHFERLTSLEIVHVSFCWAGIYPITHKHLYMLFACRVDCIRTTTILSKVWLVGWQWSRETGATIPFDDSRAMSIVSELVSAASSVELGARWDARKMVDPSWYIARSGAACVLQRLD